MRLFLALFGFAILFSIVGCGTSEVAVVAVTGNLTDAEKKPFGNVLIQLVPIVAKSCPGASAITDENGNFSFKCDNGELGAAIGDYRVTLSDNSFNVEGEYDPKTAGKKLVNRVPKIFQAADSTPLKLKVEMGKSEYPLTLAKQ